MLNKNDIEDEAYFENLKDEENKEIGFDFDLLKRNELYVNLIHFDLGMRNPENYGYYNNFKVDVVGGFHAMDDLKMFEKYLEAIKNKNIPFVVITSGSSGGQVIPICKRYPFVKEVIIFCMNYDKHKHYITDYPNYVKKVLTSKSEVYKYLKTFGHNQNEPAIQNYINSNSFTFSYEDIQMNKQLEQCPVISAYEYDKLYFLIHRAYAHFFGEMNDNKKVTFSSFNFKKVKDYIINSKIINTKEKNDLVKKFDFLKDNDNFVENSIRKYTGESGFCYIFNRTMRNFEPGLISLAYYMGPFLFGVNKYVKENHDRFGFNGNMTLYRNIQCSVYDFYLYQMNEHHIICFPSITSTSTVRGGFTPTGQATSLNTNGIQEEDLVKVTMIFSYTHQNGNISPGIIVKNYKGKDGYFLSSHPTENEVILFPFTFVRITKIKEIKKKKEYEMYLEIINRREYIEYTLRDNVKARPLFSSKD